MTFAPGWQDEDFCYLTTTGRVTGAPHTIEIWFAAHGETLYICTGHDSDTVANLRANPSVTVRIGSVTLPARARVVDDPAEAGRARSMVAAKYAHAEDGLDEWAASALPVAFDPAP